MFSPGAKGTATVPAVLRLALECALADGRLRPGVVEPWLAWLDVNARYLDHAETGMLATSIDLSWGAIAVPLQSLFIVSSIAELLGWADLPRVLLAVKSGVLSPDVAFYLRAVAEDGPTAAARACDGVDVAVRDALASCTDPSGVMALRRVCEGLTETVRPR